MSAASATRAGRAAAERQMTDTWTVYRVTSAWDEVSGMNVETTTTVYDGIGQWHTFEAYEQSPEAGGAQFAVTRSTLKLPFTVTSAEVREGDRAVCMSSRMDPDLVGSTVRIQAAASKTYATARRFPVAELQ